MLCRRSFWAFKRFTFPEKLNFAHHGYTIENGPDNLAGFLTATPTDDENQRLYQIVAYGFYIQMHMGWPTS